MRINVYFELCPSFEFLALILILTEVKNIEKHT